MKIKISDYELGWLVGILEGEGYFEYNGCSQKICVRMTDEDTMITYATLIAKIIGVEPSFKEITPCNPRAQNIFAVEVCGVEARVVMKLVAPLMHYRRRRRIWQSLNKYKPPKPQELDVDKIMPLLRKVT